MKILFLVFLLAGSFASVTDAQDFLPKREFRAAWVATIYNIDWPSVPNLSPSEQKKDLRNLFKRLAEAGINAVFFQVRGECDAFYDSQYEPWSYWLTGKQGQRPEPFYDPLETAISEAHKYGMELHAWLNPYRAVNNQSYRQSSNHVTRTNPDWILNFGSYKMLNPGVPGVTEHILKVIEDIITRYDVDGIHFDDYFYPYSPVITWQDYHTFRINNRGINSIEDWRRDNINNMIASVNSLINKYKPYLKFGVSPFGIVDNKYSGTKGMNAYSVIYCDPLTWIREKTVDYIVPQIYWEIGKYNADYARLMPWWASVKEDRHLYIGHFSARMTDPGYRGSPSEMGGQIRMNRENGNIYGSVFFSARSIANNFSNFADSLSKNYFRYPAIIPPMPWKDSTPPLPPVNLRIEREPLCTVLSWDLPSPASDGELPARFVVYRFRKDEQPDIDNPRKIIHITKSPATIYRDYNLPGQDTDYVYIVTSLDRLNNESSQTSTVQLKNSSYTSETITPVRHNKNNHKIFSR